MLKLLAAALAIALATTPLAAAPNAAQETAIAYGPDRLQTLDFTPALQVHGPAPLILFVHGGGWKRGDKDNATGRWKAPHFTSEGYAFASIDYRLVPDATVEQQAQDVADALAALLKRSRELGIAPGKTVLMGHSAGAHLVALVGTDPRYLRKAGLSYRDLAGVVPIDGAAYDVPAQIAQSGRFMRKTYLQAFGEGSPRQLALSPTAQAASPNAPSFLLLHVQRADGIAQAKELEAALRKAGTRVERHALEGKGLRGHMEINRDLGDPDYPATTIVDGWLARTVH
ncbi:alpha/beta hydrolase [Novosphingobium album (ex Hu et al. 2023)]|uniref:Alpha/beta hydrolase n=1 Tax=Novosphingobium album (ex Hu et al. 2023) TaxID=2930093 RepID=A0ABT0AXB1_9SPHN|nr:alpha/beta hydrolase [Novosphingobium album (ex Hu et al. 2023)]MCJ2177316.1 alpha/beta hydrolase [Novosphingobium album (ex Hu et al. 2023)]